MLVGLSVQSTAGATTGACYPLLEHVLQSTGPGTSGGTSANTIYTSVSALSGKAIRVAFFVEATWTNGSGWAVSAVQLFGPGVKKPCDVVQGPFFTNGTSQSITPTSAINQIAIVASSTVQLGSVTSAGGIIVRSILRNGANALQTHTNEQYNPTGVGPMVAGFGHAWMDSPNSTSAQNYNITISGTAGVSLVNDSIMLWEIMGALELANGSLAHTA